MHVPVRQRAWYYTHVIADPQDENTVYALNTGFYRSVDAGRTFESIAVPHGDMMVSGSFGLLWAFAEKHEFARDELLRALGVSEG